MSNNPMVIGGAFYTDNDDLVNKQNIPDGTPAYTPAYSDPNGNVWVDPTAWFASKAEAEADQIVATHAMFDDGKTYVLEAMAMKPAGVRKYSAQDGAVAVGGVVGVHNYLGQIVFIAGPIFDSVPKGAESGRPIDKESN